jgi:hypothetical protein
LLRFHGCGSGRRGFGGGHYASCDPDAEDIDPSRNEIEQMGIERRRQNILDDDKQSDPMGGACASE